MTFPTPIVYINLFRWVHRHFIIQRPEQKTIEQYLMLSTQNCTSCSICVVYNIIYIGNIFVRILLVLSPIYYIGIGTKNFLCDSIFKL